jgi:hypothetical protein
MEKEVHFSFGETPQWSVSAATEEKGKIELYLSALVRPPRGKRPPGTEINGPNKKRVL